MALLPSIGLFIVAGLCEIGGGYLLWPWLREGKPICYVLAGALILVLYVIIPTLQPVHLGRGYAAYGGRCIVLSPLSGWGFDSTRPDRFDTVGCLICLVSMMVIMYGPRG